MLPESNSQPLQVSDQDALVVVSKTARRSLRYGSARAKWECDIEAEAEDEVPGEGRDGL